MLRLRHRCLFVGAASFPSAVVAATSLVVASSAVHAQVTAPVGSGNTPIALSGWNENIINSAANTTGAVAFDVPNRYGYFANGYMNNYTGLPSDGASLMNGDSFQFQSYTSSNSLFLTNNTTYQSNLPGVSGTGTLVLSTPTAYSTLAFLATSANASAAAAGTVTLNFSDGSTSNYTYNAPDWGTSTASYTGTGQFARSAGDNRTSTNGALNLNASSGTYFNITDTKVTLSATDAAKKISSMTFAAPTTSTTTNAVTTAVFAVSGNTGASYTPTTLNSLNIPTGTFTAQSGFVTNGVSNSSTVNPRAYPSAFIKQTSATNSVLRLTDGGGTETTSAFTANKINVSGAFTISFTSVQSGSADGLTLLLQGNNPYNTGDTSLGGGGLGLGAAAFSNSIGVALNFYAGTTGTAGTQIVTNGVAPANNAYVTPGFALNSGTITTTFAYDGIGTITETLSNGALSKTLTYTGYNIASYVGGNSAYLGFTAGTGGFTATQDITSLSYSIGGSAATPEPTAMMFLPLGLLGVAQVVRRHAHNRQRQRL